MMAKKTKKAVRKPSTALVRRSAEAVAMLPVDASPAQVLLALARDPKLSVDKLERIIGAQERMMDRQAKQDFDAAYDLMQQELPTITKKGKIRNKEKRVVSHYSRFEDIQRVIRPILRKHGFTIKFSTDWPENKLIPKITATLAHRGGHGEVSHFMAPGDDSGFKNKIQGLGSSNAYGRRYTTIDVLNLVCEGVDDDGQGAGDPEPTDQGPAQTRQAPPKPAHDPNGDKPITQGTKDNPGQVERFHAILRSSGRDMVVVRMWLARRFKVQSSKAIKRKDYDFICKALEASGELPELAERDPGEDG